MEHNQGEGVNPGHFVENLDTTHHEGAIVPNVSNFERGLSIGVGALLIYSSVKNFKKTPLRAMIRAALGTGLIMRGSSGMCPAYSKMDVDGTKTTCECAYNARGKQTKA